MAPKQDSRVALLDAAKELFAIKGYSGTKVRDIVQKAKVNVSLVSYHFGGKEGIYREVLIQLGDKNLKIARDCLVPSETMEGFLAGLEAYVKRHISEAATRLEDFYLISREIDNVSPVFLELMEPLFSKPQILMIQFFEAAREKGFIDSSIDPTTAANLLQGQIIFVVRAERMRSSLYGKSISDQDEQERLSHGITSLFSSLFK